MSSKVVKRRIDPAKPITLTPKQKAGIAALRGKRDSGIDFSDIAPLPKHFLNEAIRNPFFKPVKASTTVGVDSGRTNVA